MFRKSFTVYAFSVFLAIFMLTGDWVRGASSAYPASKRSSLTRSLSSNAKKIPVTPNGLRYDPKMIEAAEIAESAARSYSVKRCWRYVKRALLEAEVVDQYPATAYAKSAGFELTQNFGFKKIPVKCPYDAPVGSVLVYGGRGAGHVEIRTRHGFASDYASSKPSPRPLIGVYVKPTKDRG